MNYLLDTNILSSIMTDRAGPAALRLHAVGESGSHEILTSIIVVCELRFGIEKKGSDRLRQRLEEYFEHECPNCPEIISIPKGGYVPVFEEQSVFAPLPPVAEPAALD